eukprot:Gb_09945 [translate_table: standard]
MSYRVAKLCSQGIFVTSTLGLAMKSDPKDQTQKEENAVKAGATTLKKSEKIQTSVTFHRRKILKKPRNPKYTCVNTPASKKLDQYEILKYPLITESAIKLTESNNTLVFIVDVRADKKMIRAAVKTMYGVQTKKVNTLIRPDGRKKAFVMLASDNDALEATKKIGITITGENKSSEKLLPGKHAYFDAKLCMTRKVVEHNSSNVSAIKSTHLSFDRYTVKHQLTPIYLEQRCNPSFLVSANLKFFAVLDWVLGNMFARLILHP